MKSGWLICMEAENPVKKFRLLCPLTKKTRRVFQPKEAQNKKLQRFFFCFCFAADATCHQLEGLLGSVFFIEFSEENIGSNFFHRKATKTQVMKETTWFVDEDGNKDREATL